MRETDPAEPPPAPFVKVVPKKDDKAPELRQTSRPGVLIDEDGRRRTNLPPTPKGNP